MKTDRLKIYHGAIIAFAGLGLLGVPSVSAQLYELNDPDGTNVTISSTESYSRILVGRDQPDNQLSIASGGAVDVESMVEVGQQVGATNSLISLTGGGRLVIGAADTNSLPASGIIVGDSTGSGELKVGFDSTVETDNLYVGAGSNETGSVTARNGGEIVVSGDLVIGTADNANNSVSIEDGSSLFISETSNLQVNNAADATEDLNTLNITSGGSLMVRGDVDASALSSNEGIRFDSGSTIGIGGSLSADDNSINYGLNVLLDDALSTNHTATWHADYMDVGTSTSDNTLTLRNGASATSTNSVNIGTDENALRNHLSIEGSNSTFTALSSIYVGVNGSRNKMSIQDGAQASVAGDFKIGSSVSSDNEVTLSGSNSTLDVTGEVYVGDFGSDSTLDIKDGANAAFASDLRLGARSANNRYFLTGSTNTVAGEFIIGETEDATGETGSPNPEIEVTTGNLALVGEDAFLHVQQDLTVGLEGGGSIMSIRDGGVVNVDGDVVVGEAVGDNYIYLRRGSNTQFNAAGDLIIGKKGDSNRFAVYGGTADIDGDVYLGATTNQHEIRNFIHLETTNTVLDIANSMYIGASNSINELVLAKGAQAGMTDLYIGTYDGVTNNTVDISGNDSMLTVTNQLFLGSATGTNNAVTVRDGGTLAVSAQSSLVINGTNNTVTIADQGTLKTAGWDFDLQTGPATNIFFESGSTLHLQGALEGTNMAEGGLNFVLDGAGATWAVSSNMFVGYETDNNTLTLTNGAAATVASDLYIGFDSSDNAVTVGGAGSMLMVTNNLQLGAEVEQWQRNTLTLLDGANAWVGGDTHVYRGSTVKIDAESQLMVEGDYLQDEYSVLEIGVSSNQVNPNLIVEGDAGFTSSYNPNDHDILQIFNDGISESNTVTIVKAGTISLDGEEASAGSIEGSISTNSLLGFTVTITNDTGYSYILLDNFTVRTIGDAGGLEGQLLDVADEIEWIYEQGGNEYATNMVRIIEQMDEDDINKAFNDYFGAKQSSIPANTVLSLGIQNVAEQLTIRSDNTRARMGAATASTNPSGAAGPHQAGQKLQGWIAGYGTKGTQDSTDGFSGYDASLYGFLIGVDLSVAENMLVGVAGGTGSTSIDKDNGGSSDLNSAYASLYASMGTEDWFGDASLIYGGSSVDSALGSAFDTTADYDAQNMAFYLGGGKEIINEYLIITPQASLLANYYKQEAYQEQSGVVARSVDSFDALYVQSSLGCNLGFYTALGETTLKTEFRAHWLHEFNADEEGTSYQLIGGDGTIHTLLMQAPESDLLKFGAGISAKMTEHLELRLDLDTRQSKSYSDYTALGSLRYQF